MRWMEQEEQLQIAKEKEASGEPLSWADTRRMKMTSRVIQETMRVASILSFTFREAVEDVEYQGEQQSRAVRWQPVRPFRDSLALLFRCE